MNALESAMAVDSGIDDCHTVASTRCHTRLVAFGLLLQRLPVLARNHNDKASQRIFSLSQYGSSTRAACEARVPLHEPAHLLALSVIGKRDDVDHGRIDLLSQQIELIQNERDSATHPRGEIATGAAEHDDGASCHVLAAVITDTFDYRGRPAVAYGG